MRATPGNFGQLMATFLVVVLCAWRLVARMESETKGIDVVLGQDCRKLFPDVSSDGRPIVVRLRVDGSVQVNADALADKDVIPLINKVLSTRQEKLVYLLAEDDVPYNRFISMTDRLRQGTYVDYLAMNRVLGPGRFEEQSCFAPTP